MQVSRLDLANFRTYRQLLVEFGGGVTVLTGPNGSGKTNVVEAMVYLSTLRSHRVASEAPLINVNADSALVRADLTRGTRSTRVEVELNSGAPNRVRVAGVAARPREAVGILRTVIFAPEDLTIIKGDPGNRRDFLDQLLMQLTPRYRGVISDFERVLKQRTALLRSMSGRTAARAGEAARTTLRVWDEQLATTGAALLAGRLQLVDELAPLIIRSYAVLAPASTADLRYASPSLGFDDAAPACAEFPRDEQRLRELLLERIDERRADEIERGQSLVGPHRDELVVQVDNKRARSYASHGEAWSLALALRLGSFDLLRQSDVPDMCPVLLLDDVFAELDVGRRDYLSSLALQSEQTIITAAVLSDVPSSLHHRVLTVVPGSVSG